MRPLLAAVALAVAASVPASASDGARPRQWHLDVIGAPAAGADGTGVTVAIVDSGVDAAHPDLAGRVLPGIDLVDGDDDPADAYGHGTHVAGIVAATVGGGEVVGVAPGVHVLPVRVLDAAGNGLLEDVVEGVRWAVAQGADVVNLSLGEDATAVVGPSFAEALRAAWDAGTVPVVAAGNELFADAGFSDEPVLVVAATTRDDGVPPYSSGVGSARWGIAAPGGVPPEQEPEGGILSTFGGGGYAWIAGTSQAAPQVSGAVAALLGLGLTPQEAVDRLLATAVDVGDPGPDPVFGAGRLDLAAAVAAGPAEDEPQEPGPDRRTVTGPPLVEGPRAVPPVAAVAAAMLVTAGWLGTVRAWRDRRRRQSLAIASS